MSEGEHVVSFDLNFFDANLPIGAEAPLEIAPVLEEEENALARDVEQMLDDLQNVQKSIENVPPSDQNGGEEEFDLDKLIHDDDSRDPDWVPPKKERGRFHQSSEEEVLWTAGETVASTTKTQTKWAVKTFRGKFNFS